MPCQPSDSVAMYKYKVSNIQVTHSPGQILMLFTDKGSLLGMAQCSVQWIGYYSVLCDVVIESFDARIIHFATSSYGRIVSNIDW